MKQQNYIIVMILLWLPASVWSRTIQVGERNTFHSITSAVQAAKPGDTIEVFKGLYKEKNLVIDKPLTLSGIDFPALDGEHKYEIISVKADNVIIKGFLLRNSGISSLVDIAGIKIYDRKNVSLLHNKLEGTFFGIYLQNAVNCRVEYNELTAYAASDQQSGNGIHCWKCDSLCIIGNTITRHRDGIYFEFVTNSVIWRNHSYNNIRYGLHFMFSHNDAYISNVFQNNSAGVSVMFTHGVKMFNNVFEDNWGDGCYGVFLKEITDSYITGNRFLRNTTAIFIEGSNRIQMQKNSFIDNGWGLKIQASCQDIALQYNNFTGNSFDVGTNGTLVLNTFNNNYWDKYEGYDLNKDGEGDVPYHPVSLYSMIVEKNPPVMILFRSFITTLMDKTEKVVPSLTPENLKDDRPLMKPLPL